MVHDHYLDHQPRRDTNIVSWILLVVVVSFLVGFLVHSAIGRALSVHSGEADTSTADALPPDGASASFGASGRMGRVGSD
jgi:hypothetical protein